MQEQQLTFSLPESPRARRRPARQARPERMAREARARWWFARMHRMVDAAVEWTPGPGPAARPAVGRTMVAA
ncbi:MAG: hypothetical protein RJA22_1771 [Verrucomicrobiota bacterium]|jgi:hypothetical protein